MGTETGVTGEAASEGVREILPRRKEVVHLGSSRVLEPRDCL